MSDHEKKSCGICGEDITEEEKKYLFTLCCKHEYHYGCLKYVFEKDAKSGAEAVCPYCRKGLSHKEKDIFGFSSGNYTSLHSQCYAAIKKLETVFLANVVPYLGLVPNTCNFTNQDGKPCKKSTKYGSGLKQYFCERHVEYITDHQNTENESLYLMSRINIQNPMIKTHISDSIRSTKGLKLWNSMFIDTSSSETDK
jgi:Ring finger domain